MQVMAELCPDFEWPGLDVATVQSTLDSAGLKWRSADAGAVLSDYSSPPLPPLNGYPYTPFFDFYLQFNINQLNDWATVWAESIKNSQAGSITKMVNFELADEPGWAYGGGSPTDVLSILNSSSDYLNIFRNYLQNLPQGFHPSDFGFTSWSLVTAIGASTANTPTATLPNRRLFFWTIRFFEKSASNGMSMVRDALNNAFDAANNGSDVQTNFYVNCNYWAGLWYIAEGSVGPDAAAGLMDWLESGRLNAHTLWTEDWLFDQQAQMWSFFGDSLRSAGMLAPGYGTTPPHPGEPGGFGGYVVGES